MKSSRKLWKGIFAVLAITVLFLVMTLGALYGYFRMRGHGKVNTSSFSFTESAKELRNPSRGFYHMHGFRIKDETQDFREEIAKRFCRDTDTGLAMIEINLQAYRDREISEQGLANIEALFEALETLDKQLILRFLYDWNGENMEYEPESLETILRHMSQLEPVFREHGGQIFVCQGLFIGNWGEMNGTKFLETEQLQALAKQLALVTPDSVYLAVRMPAQWRKITGTSDPYTAASGDSSLAARLGLYNDGMLGSWSDCGTYGDQTQAKNGPFTYWNREEELAFQEQLCRSVPIGGEVVTENPYNDFDNAVEDLSRMHVTYLNRDYDTKVLEKWAATTVTREGVFQGMDGLSYMERHLGYRLVLREAELQYDFERDALNISVLLQNVGFAPLYRDAEVSFLLREETGDRTYVYELEQELSDLEVGTGPEQTFSFHREISLWGEQETNFAVYVEIRDRLSGKRILLGNEQEPEEYGYRIGSVEIRPVRELWEEWKSGT